jgi:hypothetical protein
MKKTNIILSVLAGMLVMACQFPHLPAAGGADARLSYSIQGPPGAESMASLSYSTSLTVADVAAEGMKGVLSAPVDVLIAAGAAAAGGDESFTVTVAVNQRPDALIILDKSSREKEIRPFSYDEKNGKLQFCMFVKENICFLPVSLEGVENAVPVPPDQISQADALSVTKASGQGGPFVVSANDGNRITIALDSGYFRDPMGWDFTYIYNVVNQSGTTVASRTTTSTVFTYNVPSSGTYLFKVYTKFRYKYRFWFFGWIYYYGGWQTYLNWQQDVLSEKHSLSNELMDELAGTYAPILVRHASEHYRPASLEYLFNKTEVDASLNNETFALTDERIFREYINEPLLDKKKFAYGAMDSVLPFYGHRCAMINISLAQVDSTRVRLRTNPDHPVVYYTFQERPTYDFIHYHFFYAFDLKSGSPSSPGYGSHIFDRESLVVILDKSTHTPLYTVYGGHLENTSFAYCDYDYDLLDYTVNWRDGVFDQRVFWSKGRLRRPWASSNTVQHADLPSVQMDNDTIRAGNHPLVFIAEGSHAVYPYPGKYVTSVVEGFPGLIEYAGMPSSGTAYALNQIMMPPSAPASTMQNYELRNLNTGRITSYSQNRYLAFSGWMVDVLGDTNARFPPYTAREQDPVAYCSSADTVAWNWIPTDMPAILNNLQGIIDDYVTVTDPLSPF